MGMAASQVRFLSLQNRKNTIGLNLMTLSNRKTALSRDMNRVAAQYNEAMNQRNLKWSSDCGISYKDLSYDLLMKPNETNCTLPYIVTDSKGRVVLDDTEIVLDKKPTGVTYRDLAMMISAYSGESPNGPVEYRNVGNLIGGTVDPTNVKTGVTDKATSGIANENGYKIVTSGDTMPENSLRFDLMEKLGLISSTDRTNIQNKEIELYGSTGTTEGPYPIGSLMGNYYLALAHYEAYEDFIRDGDYEFSSGSNAKTGSAANTAPVNKNYYSSDGKGEINYTNTYTQASSKVTFNGASSSLAQVDFTRQYDATTETIIPTNDQNIPLFTNTISTLTATISDTGTDYLYESTNLLAMMGKTEYDATITNTDTNIKDMSWQEIINNNSAIQLHWEINDTDCERGDYEDKVTNFITAMANAIGRVTAISIDAQALDNAKQSTIAFFLGDITNNGGSNSAWSSYDASEGATKGNSVARADEANLVGEGRKKFCATLWKINRASHNSAINAKNVYNTMITFYQYYYHNKDALVIVDDTAPSFEAGTTTTTSSPTYAIDTSGVTYDESKNTYFQSGGQWYIRKECTNTATMDDSSEITATIYHYYRCSGEGTAAIGSAVQEDQISSNESKVYRTVVNTDGTYSNYEIDKTTYNNNSTTKGNKYFGSSGWINASVSGGTGEISNGKLKLTYKDENGNDVELILGTFVKDSKYATSISATPADYNERLAELQAAVDAAAAAKDQGLSELELMFASKESKIMDYFDAVFKMISKNGWVYDESINDPNKKEDSKNYLNAMLENNMYFVTEVDTLDGTDFNYATKIAQNCSSIFQVYDEAEQNIALSEYESKKAEITSKEKQLDIRMNKLEAEQDAISTELQSLKKIIDDNVSNTFKIFT